MCVVTVQLKGNVSTVAFGDNYVNTMAEKNVKHLLRIEVCALDIIIKHRA
jgi:hypothetical protein